MGAEQLLAGRAGNYGYVSSGSVYEWGSHRNEESPVVKGDPQAEDEECRNKAAALLAAIPAARRMRSEHRSEAEVARSNVVGGSAFVRPGGVRK